MMIVRLSRKDYTIYEESEAIRNGIEYKKNWYDGEVGDHVRTDDVWVVPVVYVGYAREIKYIRTPCGTYLCLSHHKMLHFPRKNRFTFSGKNPVYKVNARVDLFARMFALTRDPLASYKYAFPDAKCEAYIKSKGSQLLKLPEVKQIINDELTKHFDDEGLTSTWIAKESKKLYDELAGISSKTISSRELRFRMLKFVSVIQNRQVQPQDTLSDMVEFEIPAEARKALEISKGNAPIPVRRVIKVQRKVKAFDVEDNNAENNDN